MIDESASFVIFRPSFFFFAGRGEPADESHAANLSLVLITAALWIWPQSAAAGAAPKFGDEKTTWHGFDRYDFLMDEAVLSIKPHKVPPDERNAVRTPVKGKLRCVVVAPTEPASDNPWSLDENVRMLKSTGAKFIGRSLCLWGGEANLLRNLERARQQIPKVHTSDPDMILQACVFEIVSTQVDQVPVPDWAFTALGQPVEKRNFCYADMLYPDGRRRNQWGRNASVPDVSRPETKLWFYFLAASYIDVGCEAIHFGQAEIMNGNDRGLGHRSQLLELVRFYAAKHARRHLVLCDAHVPSGGWCGTASCSWTSTRSRCGSWRSPTSRRRRS